MDYITIGAFIGTGFAVFVTFTLFLRGYESKICVAPLLIMALILCLLLRFSVYQLDADEKNNKTIKTTISANYNNVVNHYHNNEQSFMSDSSKYTFDYDADAKTPIVLKDSDMDAIFVDGMR